MEIFACRPQSQKNILRFILRSVSRLLNIVIYVILQLYNINSTRVVNARCRVWEAGHDSVCVPRRVREGCLGATEVTGIFPPKVAMDKILFVQNSMLVQK